MSNPAHFRPARPDEAGAITRLVVRSKRHWGYSDEFIAALMPELTVSAGYVEHPLHHVEVLEADGRMIGVICLARLTELALLEDLFLDSDVIGGGYGRLMFERAAEIARGWGKGVMELESDPYAEPFYRHLGAERVAMLPVTSVPGRAVPLMRFTLR